MSRAMNVEPHHRLMYSNSVTMVAQQKLDRLQAAVTVIAATGEAQSTTDLFDAGEYQYGEARSRTNPQNPITGTRRWLMQPPVIESGDHIDKEDKFATATDPTSTYVTIHTNRVRRGVHDRTLGIRKDAVSGLYLVADGGILGYANEGKRAQTQTALPAGQYVPVGGTGLTLDKLRAAKETLQKNEFGMEDDDPLFCLITPTQNDDLLGIAAASGANLNTFNIQQLQSGKPTSLLGINWIMTNRLPVSATANTVRLCPIFSKANIIRGVWQDITGDMWNDTSAKNLPYVYVSAYVDCVRNQDKGVVVIECQE